MENFFTTSIIGFVVCLILSILCVILRCIDKDKWDWADYFRVSILTIISSSSCILISYSLLLLKEKL